jgi:hypothetical protein
MTVSEEYMKLISINHVFVAKSDFSGHGGDRLLELE